MGEGCATDDEDGVGEEVEGVRTSELEIDLQGGPKEREYIKQHVRICSVQRR